MSFKLVMRIDCTLQYVSKNESTMYKLRTSLQQVNVMKIRRFALEGRQGKGPVIFT